MHVVTESNSRSLPDLLSMHHISNPGSPSSALNLSRQPCLPYSQSPGFTQDTHHLSSTYNCHIQSSSPILVCTSCFGVQLGESVWSFPPSSLLNHQTYLYTPNIDHKTEFTQHPSFHVHWTSFHISYTQLSCPLHNVHTVVCLGLCGHIRHRTHKKKSLGPDSIIKYKQYERMSSFSLNKPATLSEI